MPAVIRSLAALVLLLLAPVAYAGCPTRLASSTISRLPALDVAVWGNEVWVATGYGVQIFDGAAAPVTPRFSLSLTGHSGSIEVIEGLGFVASDTRVDVVFKGTERLEVLATVDTGAMISELVYFPPYLYALASNGAHRIDVSAPAAPRLVQPAITTSSGPAVGIVQYGSSLYVADGDTTLEVYSANPAGNPQKLGQVATTRANGVASDGERLYVSDNVSTEIYAGTGTTLTRLGTAAGFPSLNTSAISGAVMYTSGLDRTIRAVDFISPQSPVTLWEARIPISAGATNRVLGIASTFDRLFVAGGDAGLQAWNTSSFKSPFPVRLTGSDPVSSVFSFGNVVVASLTDGGLTRYSQTTAGVLSSAKTWDTGMQSIVHDGNSMRILVSSGNMLRLIDLVPVNPAEVRSAFLPAEIRSAVLVDPVAYAALADGSLWRIDLSAFDPVPVPVTPAGVRASFVERGGAAIAIAELLDSGETRIHYSPTGNPAAITRVATVPGLATAGIALSNGGTAAALTFSGLRFVDFNGAQPSIRLVDPTAQPAVALSATATDVFVLRSDSVEKWSIASGTRIRSTALPSPASSIHVRPESPALVSIGSGGGVMSYAPAAELNQPLAMSLLPQGARFDRRIASDGRRLFFFDGRQLETSVINANGAPGPRRSFDTTPIVDFAIVGSAVMTLESGGRVRALSQAGQVISTLQLPGANIVVRSIVSVADRAWVTYSRGCGAGECEDRVAVLHLAGGNLVETASLPGLLIDVALAGPVAYALFERPAEVAVISLADPSHPMPLRSWASSGAPVSIAGTSSAVYVRGELALAERADVLPSHHDPSASRPVDPRDEIQKRRFPRPRGAHQGDEFPGTHVESDPVQHRDLERITPVDLVDVIYLDERIHDFSCGKTIGTMVGGIVSQGTQDSGLRTQDEASAAILR